MEEEDILSRLPESCISHIISLTSPPDACKAALVSTTFHAAANSDTVWNQFLPSDLPSILSRAVLSISFSSKKDLYFHLCHHPILVDGGKMSFELERSSGKKCYMISAREMNIVWSENPQFWKWAHSSYSRFSEVAELLNVCWLEIHVKFEARELTRKTTYSANIVFRVAERSNGLDFPVETSVVVGINVVSESQVSLLNDRHRPLHPHVASRGLVSGGVLSFDYHNTSGQASNHDIEQTANSIDDCWEKMKIGEFYIDEGDEGEVDICLKEVNGGHWKRGLIVQGIEVRPVE